MKKMWPFDYIQVLNGMTTTSAAIAALVAAAAAVKMTDHKQVYG